MELEFKIRKLKEGSECYQHLCEVDGSPNQFVLVSENDKFFKVQLITEGKGLLMIGGLNIVQSSYLVPKNDLEPLGNPYESATFNIPKKYLNIDIIEDILRLNS